MTLLCIDDWPVWIIDIIEIIIVNEMVLLTIHVMASNYYWRINIIINVCND